MLGIVGLAVLACAGAAMIGFRSQQMQQEVIRVEMATQEMRDMAEKAEAEAKAMSEAAEAHGKKLEDAAAELEKQLNQAPPP